MTNSTRASHESLDREEAQIIAALQRAASGRYRDMYAAARQGAARQFDSIDKRRKALLEGVK